MSGVGTRNPKQQKKWPTISFINNEHEEAHKNVFHYEKTNIFRYRAREPLLFSTVSDLVFTIFQYLFNAILQHYVSY